MTKTGFHETYFSDFFASAFENGFFGSRELRLSPPEAEYIRLHHPGARLLTASPDCADGKTWFEVQFGGCPDNE
jgi:hypothetical protein